MVATKPLVSVGLPVYNGSKSLAEAIESLLKQTVDDLEIILVDNASTDNSLEIARDYAASDKRLQVMANSKNLGAAANYNIAFAATSGQFFKWAAHDDRHEPTFLTECVAVLQADPGVSLAYTVAIDIDEDGNELFTTSGGDYGASASELDRASDIILRPSPCYEAFGLVPRAVMAKTRLIGSYTSSDRPLLLELALRGRFHEVDEPLFLHRQHPESSVLANPDGRARKYWFDPNARPRSYPVWRLGIEYRRAAAHVGLDFEKRRRLDLIVTRWAIENRRNLARDVFGSQPLARFGFGERLFATRSRRDGS